MDEIATPKKNYMKCVQSQSIVDTRRRLFEANARVSGIPLLNGSNRPELGLSKSKSSTNNYLHGISEVAPKVTFRTLPLNDHREHEISILSDTKDDSESNIAGGTSSESPSPEPCPITQLTASEEAAFAKRISYHNAVFRSPKFNMPITRNPVIEQSSVESTRWQNKIDKGTLVIEVKERECHELQSAVNVGSKALSGEGVVEQIPEVSIDGQNNINAEKPMVLVKESKCDMLRSEPTILSNDNWSSEGIAKPTLIESTSVRNKINEEQAVLVKRVECNTYKSEVIIQRNENLSEQCEIINNENGSLSSNSVPLTVGTHPEENKYNVNNSSAGAIVEESCLIVQPLVPSRRTSVETNEYDFSEICGFSSAIYNHLPSQSLEQRRLEGEVPIVVTSSQIENLDDQCISIMSEAVCSNASLGSSHNICVPGINQKAKKAPQLDYPADLNPFGEDEGDEKNEEKSKLSANPFGSDTEDEVKKVAKPKTSTNPFGSDTEDGVEHEVDFKPELVCRTPVPLPRKSTSATQSPRPSPRRSVNLPSPGQLSPAGYYTNVRSSNKKSSTESLELNSPRASVSANSTLRKKKPPAPLPPTAQTKSENNSKENFYVGKTFNQTPSEEASVDISPRVRILPTTSCRKFRKGPAPARPTPQRRPVKEMSIEDIQVEITDIEIKEQELERQGGQLEQLIQEKTDTESGTKAPAVEELVLQFLELVNEKNELFRRRSELINMRKMHQFEKEHAELEYQIRCLMLKPSTNKTDNDKEKEEEFIKRLLEVVEKRNEIIETMEIDRQRETVEDQNVTKQLVNGAIRTCNIKKTESKNKKDETQEEKMMDGEKHSPSQLLKLKFMTLKHSAKKLHYKLPN